MTTGRKDRHNVSVACLAPPAGSNLARAVSASQRSYRAQRSGQEIVGESMPVSGRSHQIANEPMSAAVSWRSKQKIADPPITEYSSGQRAKQYFPRETAAANRSPVNGGVSEEELLGRISHTDLAVIAPISEGSLLLSYYNNIHKYSIHVLCILLYSY